MSKLYEFTVTDYYDKTFKEILNIAYDAAKEQEIFEYNMQSYWPSLWKVVFIGLSKNGTEDKYYFEVQELTNV